MARQIIDGRIVFEDEHEVMDRFEKDYKPFLTKWGPKIGEQAMLGDKDAEAVIHRYRSFEAWLSDPALRLLEASLKNWMSKHGV